MSSNLITLGDVSSNEPSLRDDEVESVEKVHLFVKWIDTQSDQAFDKNWAVSSIVTIQLDKNDHLSRESIKEATESKLLELFESSKSHCAAGKKNDREEEPDRCIRLFRSWLLHFIEGDECSHPSKHCFVCMIADPQFDCINVRFDGMTECQVSLVQDVLEKNNKMSTRTNAFMVREEPAQL